MPDIDKITVNPELKITLLQTDTVWEEKTTNLLRIGKMIENCGVTDIILLPEMFTTGFTMKVESMAETMDGPAVNWMKEKSRISGSVIAGSLIIIESERYFNRFVWVEPDGKIVFYDKRHLFSIGDEDLYYTPGEERITVEYKGWRIRLLICYDLRFPVWSRNHDGYDLVIYTANWPAARNHVWKNLLITRALENQSYCIGTNRVGKDGMGIRYRGDSGCIDARGNAEWLGENETMRTFFLSRGELDEFRKKFPLLKDRDSFLL